MKAIMISIKPKYVAKILNGEKTIEIRKTMPKCDLPIDVYIYCTKDNKHFIYDISGKKPILENGKVVAKFTLNKVEDIYWEKDASFDENYSRTCELYCRTSHLDNDELTNKAWLSNYEISEYLQDKNGYVTNGYAIYISDLEIFDKPKELSEFKSYKKNIVNTNINGMVFETELDNSLIKAPQNYCYVEVE